MIGYPKTTQAVSVTSASAAISNAVGDQIKTIRVISTTNCHMAIGNTPVATTNDLYIAAGREEYFRVHPGQKVAFIRNSADGTAYVTEMTQ